MNLGRCCGIRSLVVVVHESWSNSASGQVGLLYLVYGYMFVGSYTYYLNCSDTNNINFVLFDFSIRETHSPVFHFLSFILNKDQWIRNYHVAS